MSFGMSRPLPDAPMCVLSWHLCKAIWWIYPLAWPFWSFPSSFSQQNCVVWSDEIQGLCGAVKLLQRLRNFHSRAQTNELLSSIEKKWESWNNLFTDWIWSMRERQELWMTPKYWPEYLKEMPFTKEKCRRSTFGGRKSGL